MITRRVTRKVTRRVSRWRHGHGFGVHSPFAYGFITDTLHHNSSYAYYAYDDLRSLWRNTPHSRRLSLRRLLVVYRVGLRFAPGSVTIGGADPHGLLAATIDMACRSASTASPTAKVTVWGDIRHDMKSWLAAREALSCGMSFTDGHLGVIVVDDKLPVQHFDIGI